MFTYAYTILAIIVVVFLIAKLKLTTELSMLASACAAALYHGVCIRERFSRYAISWRECLHILTYA